MSTLFVSHSSQDRTEAAEIAAWLKQQGYASIFLDFDPADGIPAGRNWAETLYKELKTCRAMLVLCSESSQASEWCFAEFIYAKVLGKEVFPIKIAPCALRPLLTELQVIDLTENKEQGYRRLRAGLEAGKVYASGARPLYPGLAVFQEEDAAIFFGRDAEAQECIDLLRKLRDFGGARLVLVLGASGSGKSSLVRAGVIPLLKRERTAWRIAGPVRPSLLSWGEAPDLAALERLPTEAGGAGATALVFIDQFEELLDRKLDEKATRFLDQLADRLHSPTSQVLVLATLRSDFLGEFQQHPAFRGIRLEQLLVGPLLKDGFVKVVEEPAKLEGIELETGLVQTIVADTETGDALPLLAFTLRELWEHYGQDGRLTVAEYRQIGGLEGSVARVAEAVLSAQASSEEQKAPLRDAFIPLVRMDEGRYVRRIVRWSSIDRQFHALLEHFVAKRLLVAKSENGERVLEVAHEALFRTWQRLAKWLDEDRENLRLQEGLRRAAREWEDAGRAGHLLNHRGVLLHAVEKLAVEPRFGIDAVEQAYLDACVNARDVFLKEKNRRELAERRRLRYTIAALVIFVLAISGFGLSANHEAKVAQEHLFKLHWVNGVDARDRSGNLLKAGHHFMEAADLAGDDLQTRNAYLAGALLTAGMRLGLALNPGKALRSAVFGRDPQQIWTWDENGTGIAWDLRDGKPLQTKETKVDPQSAKHSPSGRWIMGPGSDANILVIDARGGQELATGGQKIAFNDDESRLASWTKEGQVNLFDLAKGGKTASLQAPYEIEKVVLSRAGTRVLLIGKNNAATLWRNGNASEACQYPGDSATVDAVFSADDSRLFSWTDDGSAFLWDTRNGCRLTATLPGHAENYPAIGALFYGNGRFLLTWNHGAVGTLSRWDVETGKESAAFQYADNPAPSVINKGTLNSDESRLLTSADDGKVRIWDVSSGKELRALSHRPTSVRGAIFNASATRALTWSNDGSALLWNADTGESISFPLAHAGPVSQAAFSEDGQRILTWGEDRTARLWLIEDQPAEIGFKLPDAPVAVFWKESERKLSVLTSVGNLEDWSEQGARTQTRRLAADEIWEGLFNHDGGRILTRSTDHTVRLWNTSTGQPVTPPLRHPEPPSGVVQVTGIAYSPDERWLLSWGDDHTARVWDSENGKPLLTLDHEKAVSGALVNADRSRVLTWSEDRQVYLWDARKGTTLLALKHRYDVLGARFLEDSAEILTWSSDGLIQVWDAQSSAEPKRVFSHRDALAGAASNADGSRLLSWAADGMARLWDTGQNGKVLSVLPPEYSVTNGALIADESLMLTWSEEGVARLWDSQTGQPLTKALSHGKPLTGASLSHGVSRILAWSKNGKDGAVSIWPLDAPPRVPGQALDMQQQVRTGTRLNSLGEVDVLDADAWNRLAGKSR